MSTATIHVSELHPLLLHGLLEKLPVGWQGWDVDTVRVEFERTYGAEVPREGLLANQLAALQLLATNRAFWVDWEVFEKVSVALAGILPLFQTVQPLPPSELAKAMLIADGIRKDDYSSEVLSYVAGICLDDGLYLLPPPYLSKAQSLVSPAAKRAGLDLKAMATALRAFSPDRLSQDTETTTGLVQLVKAYTVLIAQRDSRAQLLEQRRMLS